MASAMKKESGGQQLRLCGQENKRATVAKASRAGSGIPIAREGGFGRHELGSVTAAATRWLVILRERSGTDPGTRRMLGLGDRREGDELGSLLRGERSRRPILQRRLELHRRWPQGSMARPATSAETEAEPEPVGGPRASETELQRDGGAHPRSAAGATWGSAAREGTDGAGAVGSEGADPWVGRRTPAKAESQGLRKWTWRGPT